MKVTNVKEFADINRVMKFKPNYSDSKLICITNGKEVLRIPRGKVSDFLKNGWFYTEKRIYKQYIEHLANPDKTPMPIFTYKDRNNKTHFTNFFNI